MPELPRGTVTFLFTDIEGSTQLWEQDRTAMATAVERHLTLLDAAFTAHDGVHFKTVGDAVQAAFPTTPAAVRAALSAQTRLHVEPWGAPGPVRVRMALHVGEAVPQDGDYLTPALNRLARLLGTGHGEQILLSEAAQQLARDALPDGVALHDLGEHRLRDLLEPERIFQLLHPDLPAEFPPLRSLDRQPHNLPAQPTPFLGRETELAAVVALFQRDVRLVTLTGPGGTGKTHLALQAAAELLQCFPDGVFFVPLAQFADPALVPAAVTAALGVREEPAQSPRDLVTGALAHKQLLLLLDNVEHVIEAAAFVGDLLACCSGVQVLATSRTPLRLRAEREYPVPALPVPSLTALPPLQELIQFVGVRLFIERARAVKPGFVVDAENMAAVVQICHRLDGLPLAIELAAARTRLLSPQRMLARLEQRLPLLVGGARDLPARQQTLRAAIGRSYDLLHSEEQALFRQLALFVGGVALDAVEAVVHPETHRDTLGGLERLVEHSLLRQAEASGDVPRFAMLETIREYGVERLEEAGEAREARKRHAAFCCALAEEAASNLEGRELGAWLDRLELEHGNLRAALDWALTSDPETALRLVAGMWRFWPARGYLSEGRDWIERALAVDQGCAPEARVSALYAASGFARLQGDYASALGHGEAALRLAQESGDQLGAAKALLALGSLAGDEGNGDEAEAAFTEALVALQGLNEPFWMAMAEDMHGVSTSRRGDHAAAQGLFETALARFRQIGYAPGIGVVLEHLADEARIRGDHARAASAWREGLTHHWEQRDQYAVTWCLEGLALLAATVGEAERAVRLLGVTGRLREELGVPAPGTAQEEFDATLASARSVLGEPAFTAAWTSGWALHIEEAIAEAVQPEGIPA